MRKIPNASFRLLRHPVVTTMPGLFRMGASSKTKATAAVSLHPSYASQRAPYGGIEDIVETLNGDREALAQLVREHRVLKEAIERAPMPYCVYTEDDRLLATNEAYENLHPALRQMRDSLPPGGRILYPDLVREQIRGAIPGEMLEAEVDRRVKAQRFASGKPVERDYGDRGVFRVVKYGLASGGTAGLAFDITELKKRETDLISAKIAAEEANDQARIALATERTRKQQMKDFSQLGEWLQSCQSLNELFRIIECFMASIFTESSGELYVYSNSRDVLDGACQWNRNGAIQPHIHPDDCWALRRGRMMRFGSGIIDITCDHVHDLPEHGEGRDYMCIPIIAHGETVGMLHIRFGRESTADETVFEEAVLPFAIRCAEQISLAIANVKLRDELIDQSTKDPLTGLWNRRHLMNRCRHALADAAKTGDPVSVISLDADKFKSFNDRHGHDAGDRVLRHIAEAMQAIVDEGEVAARLGGEEFLVLLPGTSASEARDRAELLRQKIEALQIGYGDEILPRVTVSLGVASALGSIASPQSLIRSSDRALYAAKDAGRNRVISIDDVNAPKQESPPGRPPPKAVPS